MLFVGYSGGGDFYTSFFMPFQEATLCRGAAIVFGGGGRPYDDRVPTTFSTAFAQSLRWHFYTGQDDPYLECSMTGAGFYRDRGFTVTEEHPAGVGHIDIPFIEVIGSQLAGGLP